MGVSGVCVELSKKLLVAHCDCTCLHYLWEYMGISVALHFVGSHIRTLNELITDSSSLEEMLREVLLEVEGNYTR